MRSKVYWDGSPTLLGEQGSQSSPRYSLNPGYSGTGCIIGTAEQWHNGISINDLPHGMPSCCGRIISLTGGGLGLSGSANVVFKPKFVVNGGGSQRLTGTAVTSFNVTGADGSETSVTNGPGGYKATYIPGRAGLRLNGSFDQAYSINAGGGGGQTIIITDPDSGYVGSHSQVTSFSFTYKNGVKTWQITYQNNTSVILTNNGQGLFVTYTGGDLLSSLGLPVCSLGSGASYSIRFNYTGSGGLNFSGSSPASQPPVSYSYVASGGLNLSGSATLSSGFTTCSNVTHSKLFYTFDLTGVVTNNSCTHCANVATLTTLHYNGSCVWQSENLVDPCDNSTSIHWTLQVNAGNAFLGLNSASGNANYSASTTGWDGSTTLTLTKTLGNGCNYPSTITITPV